MVIKGVCGSSDAVFETIDDAKNGNSLNRRDGASHERILYPPIPVNLFGVETSPFTFIAIHFPHRTDFAMAGTDPASLNVTHLGLVEASPDPTVLDVRLNMKYFLSETVDDESGSSIRLLEKLVHRGILQYQIGKLLRSKGINEIRQRGFTSLSDSADRVGDWDLNVRMEVRGSTLTLRGTMGKDFHQLLLSRWLLTNQLTQDIRFLKSLIQ